MKYTGDRKNDIFKLYRIDGATLVGEYEMPQLKATQFVPKHVIGFNEIKSVSNPANFWVDFYIDDTLFSCFLNQPKRYFNWLKKFKGVVTPDISMYPQMPRSKRINNCYEARAMAYYLQSEGFDIVPVATWAAVDDLQWSFDGLPSCASISISNNGCLKNNYSRGLFIEGVQELQRIKNPSNIIVCGRPMKELEIYPNIVYYNSFSLRMHNRLVPKNRNLSSSA